uniref:DnaJ homolog subfamily C member 8 n=1 Tax=Dicentrarchus labrax TaxID=13489 RepID=A0A8C4GH58_DICLA
MAAAGGEPSSHNMSDELFQTFISEVKQIEKRDSVFTSKQQIDRLLRPGSSYFNLNPFEVLQIDPEATDDELKKRFRALSILVHPDKNQGDPDRAQKAFEAVDKAYKLLLEPEQKKRALDVIHAGKEYVEHMVKEKKKQLKKDGKSMDVEEDDPEVFRQAVYKQTMKLFAELEIKRKEREAKDMHESSSWYILSQESGTFWLLQGRLLLLLTLFLRVKLLRRTDWLFLFPILVAAADFPDTQLAVNCFRGAPSDMRESISKSCLVLVVSVVNQVVFPAVCDSIQYNTPMS